MVTHQDNMLGSLQDRDQRLGLCRLSGLVNQDLSEAEVANSSVEGCNTSSADDICVAQNLILGLSLQILELLLVFFIEFTLVIFLFDEFLHADIVTLAQVLDLFVQA